jgi:hypothetical protein
LKVEKAREFEAWELPPQALAVASVEFGWLDRVESAVRGLPHARCRATESNDNVTSWKVSTIRNLVGRSCRQGVQLACFRPLSPSRVSAVIDGMVISKRLVASCIGLLSISNSAGAENKPATTVNRLPPQAIDLQEVGAKSLSLLTIWCDFVNQADQIVTSGTRARCFFSSTHVNKQSAEETQKALTQYDTPKVMQELSRDLHKCSNIVASYKQHSEVVREKGHGAHDRGAQI